MRSGKFILPDKDEMAAVNMVEIPNGDSGIGDPTVPPPPPASGGANGDDGPIENPSQWYEHIGAIVLGCLICLPVGLAFIWTKRQWPTRTKQIATAIVIGVAILLGAIGAVSGSDSSDQSSAATSTSTTRPKASTTTLPNVTTTAPVTTTTPPTTAPPTTAARAAAPAPPATDALAPAPAAGPSESVSQRNARQKASQYLSIMSFSRSGLIRQLEFEGFSNADATYGVDANNVDWNQQAAAKAADYLSMMSFSRSGLITQLLFEGFSQAQAEYGVSTTGL